MVKRRVKISGKTSATVKASAATPAHRLAVVAEITVPGDLTPGLFGDALQKALEDANFGVRKMYVKEVK